MGWWDEGIMGGDTPLDFSGEFEDKFGSKDPHVNEWRIEDGKEPLPFIIPTAEQGVEFIKANQGYDGAIAAQVTGWLMIERGAPMSNELRQLVLSGIDEEISEGAESWGNPETRIARLQEFRKVVEAYPQDGSQVDMPANPGLFEKLANHLGGQ